MTNPNEQFFTCIPGLTPDEHRDAFRALSNSLQTIMTQNDATPRMIDAESFFTYLQDMEAYQRYFLPQASVLATRPDDYLETYSEEDSEEDDPEKNRWISPALALRFTMELRGQVPVELDAFLAHFNHPRFFTWLHAEGDVDGLPFADALRDILDGRRTLPHVQFRDMTARLMATLWGWEASRLAEQHPGIEKELLVMNEAFRGPGPDEFVPRGFERHHADFEHALMESHCWANHGVSSADFVFPTFFGINIRTLGQGAE